MRQCRCERLLQTVCKTRLSFKPVAPPGHFAEPGCIIIGRIRNLLKSPKTSLEPPIFCLPNSNILAVPSNSSLHTLSDVEDDESGLSSTIEREEANPSSSTSLDLSQNEESFSFSTSHPALETAASTPTRAQYFQRTCPTISNIATSPNRFSQRLATFSQRGFKDDKVLGLQTSFQYPQSSGSAVAYLTEAESSSTRIACEAGCGHPESMRCAVTVDSQSSTLLGVCEVSATSLGKRKAQEYHNAYPSASASNVKPNHTLRRMPRLAPREHRFQQSPG